MVVVAVLELAMVDVGRNVYGGGKVTIGEFRIWLSSLSSGSLSDLSDGVFLGSLNGGKSSSSTGEGSLVSLRTSSRS